jgi:transcriptional regulator with XRE-family HTH domain
MSFEGFLPIILVNSCSIIFNCVECIQSRFVRGVTIMKRQKLDAKTIGYKIKLLREERSLSMRDLAAISDLSVSFISRVESGKTSLSVMSLQKLLEAMNVDFYDFFADKSESNPSEQIVFRKSAMAVSEDPERRWYYAYPKHPDIRFELTYEEYQAHLEIIEEESHRSDIGGFVISGELTLDVVDQGVFVLKAGDAFYIKAGQLHSTRNNSDKVLKIVAARIV